VDETVMSLEEAKEIRLELMKERVARVQLQNKETSEEFGYRDLESGAEECLFGGTFNMCEH
jgi:hypothetical protein